MIEDEQAAVHKVVECFPLSRVEQTRGKGGGLLVTRGKLYYLVGELDSRGVGATFLSVILWIRE